MSDPKICVIGAGPCGIAVVKNLLQQGLTNVVVFEKNSQLGGNWIFSEQNNHASVYETTHIISSKRLSEYDDFPMPDSYPDYPSHDQLLRYFQNYAAHFGVCPYIRFNTEVMEVTQIMSRCWRVVYRDANGEQEALFDYLFVANGHHWDPLMPSYPGVFQGDLLHSHDYKKSSPFKDKRVLVVGGGNSACDIAVEIARVAAKTFISIRKGQHIVPKFVFGKPTDMAFAKIKWMPFWGKQLLVAFCIRLLQGRYEKYHLKKPISKVLSTHPTVNSELLYFIRHGKICPRSDIKQFSGESVIFMDGSKERFDVVIFATGYKIRFPFFDKIGMDDDAVTQMPLYQKMCHPEFETLFFIGLFQPQGCIWPLADHQAHIAAKIIKGILRYPANMLSNIQKEARMASKRFKASPRHVLEVDYHAFRKQLLNALSMQDR